MKSVYLLLFLYSQTALAQLLLDGHVYDEQNKGLESAIIYLNAYDLHTLSDSTGYFAIDLSKIGNFRPGSIIISRVGFETDTVYIPEPGHYDFIMRPNASVTFVEVRGRRAGTYLANTVNQIEVIHAVELTKSACCDLAGCFNTQGSVQVNTTNQLTQAKELRLLGTSGVYNQLLVEGLPLFIANSWTYGINHLSGSMIQSIMVAKGTTSILQGYDAITGQINVILKKYDQMEDILLNGYINNFGDKQINANAKAKMGEVKLSQSIHLAFPGKRFDFEGDGFLNFPMIQRGSYYQIWEYGSTEKPGYALMSGIMYTTEERMGGQFNFIPAQHRGGTDVYGQEVRIRQPTFFTKHYYNWNDQVGLGWYSSYQEHQQESWFGLQQYEAHMKHLWSNMQLETKYGHDQLLKAGLSFRYFQNHERVTQSEKDTLQRWSGLLHKVEYVPGIFVENLSEWFDHKLSLIVGLRLDRHHQYGLFFTPRMMLRYHFDENWTYRLSAGKGIRTVNLLADYPQILGGNRRLIFQEDILPEQAYTLGHSIHYTNSWGPWEMMLGADMYGTWFVNQVFPNFDLDPTSILIRNSPYDVRSYNTQLDFKLTYNSWLESKFSYTYLDVFEIKESGPEILPFVQRHRFSASLSVRPDNSPVFFDANMHLNGSQRLPYFQDLPEVFQYDPFSPQFMIFNAQVTYKFKNIEIYGGCENIGGFIQRFPLRAYQEPFGPYFDITTVWGPTRPQEFYLGFRFIPNKKG